MPTAYVGAQILAGSLVNDRFWAANLKEAMALSGQEGTLVKSFHSGRSIPGTLKTGHSIGPTDFAGLNFSYVEVAVIVVAQCMKFERPV
jgi:hypothetical protein